MTGDIVERLRRWVHSPSAVPVSDLLDEAALAIESLRQESRLLKSNGRSVLPRRLRESVTQARAIDRSDLLRDAAAEIERLHTVIDCYAHSAAAACREINAMRGVK
jgi:hypothetical protein